jgi:tryptophan synthase alpha chain
MNHTQQTTTNTGHGTPIMAHMIPYYPSLEASIEVAKGIVDGGGAYLEIQFPFSDPSADGPVIEQACTKALASGFTTSKGFSFVRQLADYIQAQGSPCKIFIMTYASICYARGINAFVADSVNAGAQGLIIPDLPPDSDEGLYGACKQAGLSAIPVVVPFMSVERLTLIHQLQCPYIYCALRAGITGQSTSIQPETLSFLHSLKQGGARILAGFGINTPDQVQALSGSVDAAIVGSALVRLVSQWPAHSLRQSTASFIQSLSAGA